MDGYKLIEIIPNEIELLKKNILLPIGYLDWGATKMDNNKKTIKKLSNRYMTRDYKSPNFYKLISIIL